MTLGVSTLLANVPVSLGAAHQAGALTLFSIVLTLLYALRGRPGGAAAAAAGGGVRALKHGGALAGPRAAP